MIEPDQEGRAVVGMLGPRDARILEAFMVTGSLPKAARVVGVDRSTAWRVSRTGAFQAELRRRLDEQAQTSRLRLLELQARAWAAVDELLASADERIRARVAMWVADRGIAEARLQDREPSATALELYFESLERALLVELTDPEAADMGTDG